MIDTQSREDRPPKEHSVGQELSGQTPTHTKCRKNVGFYRILQIEDANLSCPTRAEADDSA